MLRQIVRRIIWMNASDTRKSDQTKAERQKCSCSMEYPSFVYISRAPSSNNTVYIISVSQALVATVEGRPKLHEDRFCPCYRVFRADFRFRDFFLFSFFKTALPY